MNRQEHIEWCKQRAIAEMDYYNEPQKGIVSMMSDLSKHPETNSAVLISLCTVQLLNSRLTRQQVINFLNGFN